MKIKEVLLFRVKSHPRKSKFKIEDRQAQMLDIYPEYNTFTEQKKASWEPDILEEIYVEIKTDEEHSGIFGPIEESQAFIIYKSLSPFIAGQDPLEIEILHDKMLRLNRHGRAGLFIMAISAIDCALWDLKGKVLEQPVYKMLEGPLRDSIPAYASMLGFSINPEKAYNIAEEYKNKGFAAQKWFFRYGPGSGDKGKEKNIVMAKAVREAVGPDYTLMFDAFMSWDLAYALDMLKALEPVNPYWVEEPIPPERIEIFKKIKQSININIATGEHVYTRWQFKELLINNAVDILQPDPDWTGGISEVIEICSLASEYDVPVICHGHSLLPALHIAASQSPALVPYVEFLIQHMPKKQHFHKYIFFPDKGKINLPGLPGLGIEIDNNKVKSREYIKY